jgi:hypothetical protein
MLCNRSWIPFIILIPRMTSTNSQKIQELITKFLADTEELSNKLKNDINALEFSDDDASVSDTSLSDNTFWAIRPCESPDSEYRRFMNENFADREPAAGDEFNQGWSFQGQLKHGRNSVRPLNDIYTSNNPLGELSNLYNNHAPTQINRIYTIPIGGVFYSVHRNHLWECRRIGDYTYDPTKFFPHRFRATILRILDLDTTEYTLRNKRYTVTTITFNN